MQPYVDSGAIKVDGAVDTSSLKGKTAVVTGGANGIGEAYVKALVKAGAFVVFGDIDESKGSKLASELSKSAEFAKCDVTSWKDQLALFKKANSSSPSHRIDLVIANAGITGPDPLYINDASLEDPEEPKFKVLDINLIGVSYTAKLALHYFNRQHKQGNSSQDQCLIFQGSLAGYLDLPEAVQYNAAKYGLRGMMKNLRRTCWRINTRVNYIAPWFIKTGILPPEAFQMLEEGGVPFATLNDVAEVMTKIASDQQIVGRSFAVVPRVWSPKGYYDLDLDDYKGDSLLATLQTISAGPASKAETMEASK